jgi:hypothetical protein
MEFDNFYGFVKMLVGYIDEIGTCRQVVQSL